MSEYVIINGTRFNDTRPANSAWHTVAAFPVRILLTSERSSAAIRPACYFRTVISGVHNYRVLFKSKFFELIKDLANHCVMLNHTIGINTKSCLTLRLFLEMSMYVHSCRVKPQEKWLICILCIIKILKCCI